MIRFSNREENNNNTNKNISRKNDQKHNVRGRSTYIYSIFTTLFGVFSCLYTHIYIYDIIIVYTRTQTSHGP